jgi:NAD(P)-dependent dehydrogenase (short-subunit alcohol dehydrogenase family)
MVCGMMSLSGQVAVVAGATRGAGRGIARALGEAGAAVYCTGRSTRDNPSPYKRPETIEETAEMIATAGGRAVAIRVDHTLESEVQALFERVDKEQGRLDVLVNSVAGEDPMPRPLRNHGSRKTLQRFAKAKIGTAVALLVADALAGELPRRGAGLLY